MNYDVASVHTIEGYRLTCPRCGLTFKPAETPMVVVSCWKCWKPSEIDRHLSTWFEQVYSNWKRFDETRRTAFLNQAGWNFTGLIEWKKVEPARIREALESSRPFPPEEPFQGFRHRVIATIAWSANKRKAGAC